jgi:hypothetical protein
MTTRRRAATTTRRVEIFLGHSIRGLPGSSAAQIREAILSGLGYRNRSGFHRDRRSALGQQAASVSGRTRGKRRPSDHSPDSTPLGVIRRWRGVCGARPSATPLSRAGSFAACPEAFQRMGARCQPPRETVRRSGRPRAAPGGARLRLVAVRWLVRAGCGACNGRPLGPLAALDAARGGIARAAGLACAALHVATVLP